MEPWCPAGLPGHGGQWRRCRGDPRAPAPARKGGRADQQSALVALPIEEPKLTDESGICGQKQEMAPATNLWVEGVDGEGARSHLAGSDPSAAAAGDEWNRKWVVVVVDWKQDKEKPGQWSFTWHATARTARPVQFSSTELSAVGEKRTNNNHPFFFLVDSPGLAAMGDRTRFSRVQGNGARSKSRTDRATIPLAS